MAALWFYKTPYEEGGPVTFRELVELVRAGRLREEDRVRAAVSEQWRPARDVVGLFYTAGSPPAGESAGPVAAAQAPQKTLAPGAAEHRRSEVPVAGRGALLRRILADRWKIVAGAAGVVLAAVLAGWWSSRSSPFPPPHLGSVAGTNRSAIEAMRAPRPPRPTLPSLPERAPQLVPGLENWVPAFSPCLTPDLCTIVFSATGNPNTGYDLYLASRSHPERPFDPPRLVQSCVSPETDAYPALSPDGLELIFARSDWTPQLFRAIRRSVHEDFGLPAVWTPVDYNAGRQQRLERPQWLDRHRVMFCFVELGAQRRSMLVAERSRKEGPFDKVWPMPFSNPWPLYFLAPNGLRAYHGTAEGIFLAVRNQLDDPFGEGEVLLTARLTGPIDGPLWVAPQEDLIVYCSPGPGKKPASSRRLWMIRY